MKHYNQISENDKKIWISMQEIDNYEPSREEKI